ncbi:MAG: hypothetical protein ABL996_23595, partial [Micropepsaceae bacterium]
VPPNTYPRGDGKNPFVVLNWDGTPLTTQTEIVSRYAAPSEGADVVEVTARVERDPGLAAGTKMHYEVRYAPHAMPPGPGAADLGDFATTDDLPPAVQAPTISNIGCPRSVVKTGDRATCNPTVNGANVTYTWTASNGYNAEPAQGTGASFSPRINDDVTIGLRACNAGGCATVQLLITVQCKKAENGSISPCISAPQ